MMRRIEQGISELEQSSDAGSPPAIQASDSVAALKRLIMQHDDPARLIECYYWSKEPGLLECVRAFLAAPSGVRTILLAFFAAAVARDQITASIESDGSLRLNSPEAAAILARFFLNDSSRNIQQHCC